MIEGAPQKRFCRPCRRSRYRVTTRYLAPGEAVPEHEPRRYLASHGYIRLRWKVAPKTYVETYEHRVFNGRVTDAEHVHHVNRDRADNRPSNLRPLSADDHALEHAAIPWWAQAAMLYTQGLSTYEVGEKLSRNPATVYRALKRMGVQIRTEARIAIPKREQLFRA